jgi:hypothetical protein
MLLFEGYKRRRFTDLINGKSCLATIFGEPGIYDVGVLYEFIPGKIIQQIRTWQIMIQVLVTILKYWYK